MGEGSELYIYSVFRYDNEIQLTHKTQFRSRIALQCWNELNSAINPYLSCRVSHLLLYVSVELWY